MSPKQSPREAWEPYKRKQEQPNDPREPLKPTAKRPLRTEKIIQDYLKWRETPEGKEAKKHAQEQSALTPREILVSVRVAQEKHGPSIAEIEAAKREALVKHIVAMFETGWLVCPKCGGNCIEWGCTHERLIPIHAEARRTPR